MISESKAALVAALEEYYSHLIDEQEVFSAEETATAKAAEGVGLVIHYSIYSIKEKAKQLSSLRARYMVSKDGEPATSLIITDEEDSLMEDWIREGATAIYKEFSFAFKDIDNACPIDIGVIPSVYVEQITFLREELWTIGSGETLRLFRCLSDTVTPPSETEAEWLLIEDGLEDRVYFIMLLREYWDRNASDLLDQSLFMSLVAFILKEWYSITGAEADRAKWNDMFKDYTGNAKSATYRLVKGITRKCSVI